MMMNAALVEQDVITHVQILRAASLAAAGMVISSRQTGNHAKVNKH